MLCSSGKYCCALDLERQSRWNRRIQVIKSSNWRQILWRKVLADQLNSGAQLLELFTQPCCFVAQGEVVRKGLTLCDNANSLAHFLPCLSIGRGPASFDEPGVRDQCCHSLRPANEVPIIQQSLHLDELDARCFPGIADRRNLRATQ